MNVSEYSIFPTRILQVDVSSQIDFDCRKQLVDLVDNIIETRPDLVSNNNPRIQSRTVMFDQGCPPVVEKLKKSFIFAAEEYLRRCQLNLTNTSVKGWFFKTWKSLDQDVNWHHHLPAAVSGVFYLKGFKIDPVGTFFKNSSTGLFDQSPTTFRPVEGSWLIFPSHLSHTNGKAISEEPRYVFAADYYGIKSY